MATPSVMNNILSDLRDRISDATRDAMESSKAAMNSYGAGYDRGYLDALTEIFASITGEEP